MHLLVSFHYLFFSNFSHFIYYFDFILYDYSRFLILWTLNIYWFSLWTHCTAYSLKKLMLTCFFSFIPFFILVTSIVLFIILNQQFSNRIRIKLGMNFIIMCLGMDLNYIHSLLNVIKNDQLLFSLQDYFDLQTAVSNHINSNYSKYKRTKNNRQQKNF